MGILNVTPDSFSDGGRFFTEKEIALAAMEMIDDGADIIDIGGESTRPGAKVVSEEEELSRVLPIVKRLRTLTDIPISIDTMKARVAREALCAGADIINDVSAFGDPDMADVVLKNNASVILMEGYSRHINAIPYSENCPAEVFSFLNERLQYALDFGIPKEKIAIDPGLGFGKSTSENINVLNAIPEFSTLSVPILIGPSRKRFVGELTSVREADERLSGSITAMVWALWHGAKILRMHDVKAAREAISIATAIAGNGCN